MSVVGGNSVPVKLSEKKQRSYEEENQRREDKEPSCVIESGEKKSAPQHTRGPGSERQTVGRVNQRRKLAMNGAEAWMRRSANK